MMYGCVFTWWDLRGYIWSRIDEFTSVNKLRGYILSRIDKFTSVNKWAVTPRFSTLTNVNPARKVAAAQLFLFIIAIIVYLIIADYLSYRFSSLLSQASTFFVLSCLCSLPTVLLFRLIPGSPFHPHPSQSLHPLKESGFCSSDANQPIRFMSQLLFRYLYCSLYQFLVFASLIC